MLYASTINVKFWDKSAQKWLKMYASAISVDLKSRPAENHNTKKLICLLKEEIVSGTKAWFDTIIKFKTKSNKKPLKILFL